MHTDQHADTRDRKRERLQQKRAHGPGPLGASFRKMPQARWRGRTYERLDEILREANRRQT